MKIGKAGHFSNHLDSVSAVGVGLHLTGEVESHPGKMLVAVSHLQVGKLPVVVSRTIGPVQLTNSRTIGPAKVLEVAVGRWKGVRQECTKVQRINS